MDKIDTSMGGLYIPTFHHLKPTMTSHINTVKKNILEIRKHIRSLQPVLNTLATLYENNTNRLMSEYDKTAKLLDPASIIINSYPRGHDKNKECQRDLMHKIEEGNDVWHEVFSEGSTV